MSDARDEDIEMRHHALDDDSLDRLLSGRIPPDDAPPGLSSVAALFSVASGPATAEEFDREAEVVTAGVLAIRTSSTPSASLKRRSPMLAKLLSAKFAAAAAVAVLGAGTTAAAATGNLPTQRMHPLHAHHAHLAGRHHSTTKTGHRAAHHRGTSTTSTSSTTAVVPSTTPRTVPAGTAAAGHSTFGLCTAYLASQGSGHNVSATPFKALIAAHGGAAGTTTFCHAFVTAHHPGTSTTSTSSTTAVVSGTARQHGIPASEHGTPAHTPVSMTGGRPETTQTSVSTGRPATTEPPATAAPSATAGTAPVVTAPVTTPNLGGTNTGNSASDGHSASGSNVAGTASGGASSSGSGNASNHT